MIGNIALRLAKKENRVWLGYTVNAHYHNHGYTTEAAACLRDFVREMPGVHLLSAQTLEANRASHRVLEKLGMTCVARQLGKVCRGNLLGTSYMN